MATLIYKISHSFTRRRISWHWDLFKTQRPCIKVNPLLEKPTLWLFSGITEWDVTDYPNSNAQICLLLRITYSPSPMPVFRTFFSHIIRTLHDRPSHSTQRKQINASATTKQINPSATTMQLKVIFLGIAAMSASAFAAPAEALAAVPAQGCVFPVGGWYGRQDLGCVVHECPPGLKFIRAFSSCWIERECCLGKCCPLAFHVWWVRFYPPSRLDLIWCLREFAELLIRRIHFKFSVV